MTRQMDTVRHGQPDTLTDKHTNKQADGQKDRKTDSRDVA